jgi:hypothetical protein
MNFASGNYIDGYIRTLEALGLDEGEKSLQLTPTEWANDFTIFAIKLASGPVGQGVRSIVPSGSASLSLVFAEALTEAVDVVMMLETQATLEIDHLRNVIMS